MNSVCTFACASLFFEGPIAKKLFIAVVPVNVVAVGTIFAQNLVSYIAKQKIIDFMPKHTVLRLITVILSNIFIIALLIIVKHLTAKPTLKLKDREWFLLSFDLVISTVSYMFLFYAIFASDSITANLYCALSAVAIIVINITIYVLLTKYSERSIIETENKLLKQQMENQAGAIRETKKQYDELSKMRHDFKNILGVISNLNQMNKSDEIDEYISKTVSGKGMISHTIKTGNSYLDAIVNMKISEAAELGVNVVFTSISNLEGDYIIDLCSLLGNMFDNAIRASASSDKKTIKLDIRRGNGSLTVLMRNSIDSSVLSENPELKTDKTNRSMHGYGTKIMRDITDRYNGTLDFYEEYGEFCCNIILYI